jgi:hypothetical protein
MVNVVFEVKVLHTVVENIQSEIFRKLSRKIEIIIDDGNIGTNNT